MAARHWIAVVVCSVAPAATASEFLASTHLVGVESGSDLSALVETVGRGGYELADGTPFSYSEWYATDFKNLSATWITQVNENMGLIWGFGTGEKGQQYTIDPSLTVGFLVQKPVSPRSTVSLRAMAILGGTLNERSCTADYGAIGGVQEVNCRLAATVMRPKDTLDHLLNEKPPNRVTVSLYWDHRF